MSSARRIRQVTAAVLLLSLVVHAGAVAQEVPRLTGPVTDLVGAVSGREGEIESVIGDVRERSDVQLWVLFDDTTGGIPVTDYVDRVAEVSGLGVGDALYAVTLEDRTYALWVSDTLEDRVSAETQDRILLDARDRLAEDDLVGAASTVARGLGDAVTGPSPAPFLALLLIAGLAGLGVFLFMRRRAGAESGARRANLNREANALLLETDEALKGAQQELGFVEAMYGEADMAAYAAAIDTATTEMQAAFELRQKLDDAEPEDADTEERMLREILERAGRAKAALADEQQRIRSLRELEQEAPKLLERLGGAVGNLEERLTAADRTHAALEEYAPSNWEAVSGDRTEAEKRIEFAREQVAAGQEALAGGDTSRAAVAVREATQAVSEAAGLLDALDGAARELAAAREQLTAEIREAENDIEVARRVIAGGAGGPDAASRIAEAEATLDAARRLSTSQPLDVLGALERANAAESIADDLVAGVRRAEETRATQATMLKGAIASAQARVELAGSFVTTRRHGVGVDARVRVSEAERHLASARALAGTNVEAALEEARRAERLADEAYRLASSDFGGWDQRPPTTVAGGTGGDFAGALLGGILGGLLTGGGSGAGWGGSDWGRRGRGAGGRPSPRIPTISGGSRRSGGGGIFGGGGRAGGGRIGGGSFGGGRARGGRW
jgi:hypothetical protein